MTDWRVRRQEAIAIGFEREASEGFFAAQRAALLQKRTVLLDALSALGVPHDRPQGAYFVLFDTSALAVPEAALHPDEPRDWDVCRFFTSTIGYTGSVKEKNGRWGGGPC
jgi:kynurenine aminotransferase